MKKLCMYLIIFILFFIPNVVFGEIIESGNLNSIPVDANSRIIYFNGFNKDTISIDMGSDSHFAKTDGGIIYYKGKMEKDVSASNVATITMRNAAYYLDDAYSKVYLDIVVNINNVSLKAFSSPSSNACSDNNKYEIAQVYKDNFELYIWEVDNSFSRIDTRDSLSKCQANASYNVSFTLVGDLPSNFQFPWRIRDLDQPDKQTGGYDGPYAEAIQFNSGFSGKYYVLRGNDLNYKNGNSDNKFSGKKSTVSEEEMKTTTVATFQTSRTANVTWIGSMNVGTGLLGMFLTPESRKFVVNDCQSKQQLNASCGNESQVVDKVTVERKNEGMTKDNLVGSITKKNIHSSCKEKTINLKDVCLKNNNKKVHASVSVDVILTEDIRFQVEQPYYLSSDGQKFQYVYAGGGFSWDGAFLENNVGWVYKYFLTDESNPMIKAGYNYYSVTDGVLYDSSCSHVINKASLSSMIDAEVRNIISGKKVNLVFKSNDVNDASKKNINMNDIHAIAVTNNINNFIVTNNVKLNVAYLNKKTNKVDYGNHSGDDNYTNQGKKYFVPLKYIDKVFYIGLDRTNISLIGQKLGVSVMCDINVEQILYENSNDDNDKKLNVSYRYRPIDVSNPFPKAKSKEKVAEKAENWAEWYYGENGSIHQKRLSTTFDNQVFYTITINNSSNISGFNNKNSFYADFGSMNIDGTSNFVSGSFSGSGFSKSYCPLGEFKTECDWYK